MMVLEERVVCYSTYALILLGNVPAPARTISETINERFARVINTVTSDVYSAFIRAKNACLFTHAEQRGHGRLYSLEAGFYGMIRGEIRQATEEPVARQNQAYTDDAGIMHLLGRQKNSGPPSLVSVFNGTTVKYKKLRQRPKVLEGQITYTYKRLKNPRNPNV